MVQLLTVGKAVCAILQNPTETANRTIRVQDTATTLNALLAMAQKATGAEGWTVAKPSVDEMLAGSWAGVKQDKFDWPTLFGFLVAASMGEGYGGQHEKTDNVLLGLPQLSEAGVQAFISQVAEN